MELETQLERGRLESKPEPESLAIAHRAYKPHTQRSPGGVRVAGTGLSVSAVLERREGVGGFPTVGSRRTWGPARGAGLCAMLGRPGATGAARAAGLRAQLRVTAAIAGCPGGTSPNRRAHPTLRSWAPRKGRSFEGAAPLGGRGRRGPLRERAGDRAACSPRCAQEPGPLHAGKRWPLGTPGTSASASCQEGIFPKRNRFVGSLVRWGSYATEKPPPSAAAAARFAADPDVPEALAAPLPASVARVGLLLTLRETPNALRKIQ